VPAIGAVYGIAAAPLIKRIMENRLA